MADIMQILLEMGFDKETAEDSVRASGGTSVEDAILWIEQSREKQQPLSKALSAAGPSVEHTGSSQPDPLTFPSQKDQSHETAQENAVQSFVCNNCGKQLKSQADIQIHASSTGHEDYAESSDTFVPLTEEQKKEKLASLQAKLKEKRLQKEAEEKQKEREMEMKRRQSGKELLEFKERAAYEETRRYAEERKKEKAEEKLLMQKLIGQIANDRAQHSAKQKPHTEHTPPEPKTVTVKVQLSEKVHSHQYNSCSIQFRLPDGTRNVGNFLPSDKLDVVRRHVLALRPGCTQVVMSTTLPRREFGPADTDKTVLELGLVPSSVLIVSRLY